MIYFNSDYMAGAHPEVMQRLLDTNFEHTVGYGCDQYSERAVELIREACDAPKAQVFFLVGGTQTNATVIDGLLARHEGVLAPESAHINVHEAGAIEATGHKVLTLPHCEGKVRTDEVENYINDFYRDETFLHMVAPGMLYISFPTEYGTIYTLGELEALSRVCRKAQIPLYIDGARLGYGLAATECDVTFKDIARLADVFYIGGTKMGALMGEAVVVTNGTLLKNMMPLMKQHGALLAKGRLLGLQFDTLFTNDLYMRIGRYAVELAITLKEEFTARGYESVVDSPTNQQFFRLPNDLVDRLSCHVGFELWGPKGETSSVVRFVTSWSTTKNDLDKLISLV
ncbi:MAG: low specificity L-threonine aldolase [Muribaculaceae bacterium]|nr:low specificity L-threonine aldolase [Muribaculaceae bacterium]